MWSFIGAVSMETFIAILESIFCNGNFISFLFSVARMSTAYILVALSASISQQSGVNNMMAETMMTVSAFVGVVVSAYTQNFVLGVLSGIVLSIAVTLFMCFATFVMRVDLYLMSISLNLAMPAATIYCMYLMIGVKSLTAGHMPSLAMPDFDLPIIKDIPIIGDIFSGHNGFTYIAWLAIFAVWILIYKTKFGLRMRAIAANPEVGDSLGLRREKIYTQSFVLATCVASLGGTYLSMGYFDYYLRGMTAGRGFIGMSAASVAGGKPIAAALLSIIYSLGEAFTHYAKPFITQAQFLSALPYLLAVILILLHSTVRTIRGRKLSVHRSLELLERYKQEDRAAASDQ